MLDFPFTSTFILLEFNLTFASSALVRSSLYLLGSNLSKMLFNRLWIWFIVISTKPPFPSEFPFEPVFAEEFFVSFEVVFVVLALVVVFLVVFVVLVLVVVFLVVLVAVFAVLTLEFTP